MYFGMDQIILLYVFRFYELKILINDYNNRKRKEIGFFFVCINNLFVDLKLINIIYLEKGFFLVKCRDLSFFYILIFKYLDLGLRFFFGDIQRIWVFYM